MGLAVLILMVCVEPLLLVGFHLQNVLRYDPETDTYEACSELPLPDWHCFTAVAVGHKVYVLGGASKGKWSGAAYCYNTRANTWRELPPMTTARRRCVAVVVPHPVS